MNLYHRTTSVAAAAILAEGFRDHTGNYLVEGDHSFNGVWLSDVPLDCNDLDRIDRDLLLLVTLDVSETELDYYEWKEEGKGHREWHVPAALINTRGRVKVVSEEE